jgi:hypothetical protein
MRTNIGTVSAALAIALSLGGCFAIVDLEKFHVSKAPLSGDDGGTSEPESGAPMTGYSTLKFHVVGFTPHLTQLFEWRVIDSNRNIVFLGRVNPLGTPDVTITAPMAVPPGASGSFHLDFWADMEGLGHYDKIGSVLTNDHAWRIDPLQDYPEGTPHQNGVIQVTFVHNTDFTEINDYPSGTPNPPIDTTLPTTVTITNAGALMGKLVQVRIAPTGTGGQTIGLYRVPKVTDSTVTLLIPGVVEPMGIYDVLVYADANGNGVYDNPANGAGNDLGWSTSGTTGTNGLNVTVDASNTAAGNVDVGAP